MLLTKVFVKLLNLLLCIIMSSQFDNLLIEIKAFSLNFGPQHPVANDVLRVVLQLKGELMSEAAPHKSILNRGAEEWMGHKWSIQALPYYDRLDYVLMLTSEHAYTISLEEGINIPIRAEILRELLDGITRIINHIKEITTHGIAVRVVTPFLWTMEEHIKLMVFYERFPSVRINSRYDRPGGIDFDNLHLLLIAFKKLVTSFLERLNAVQKLLISNKVWKMRKKNIGKFFFKKLMSKGQKSSSLNTCARKKSPYAMYKQIKWNNWNNNAKRRLFK